jgi:hypothetical protein
MMRFIEKASPWSRGRKMASAPVACVLGAACMLPLLFGAAAVAAQGNANSKSYVGIWRMTVQDKRVGTLELMTYDGRLTGSITNAHATIDGNGKLVEFDAIPGAAPIVQASISQDVLAINTEEANESITSWNMSLTGEGKGTLQLAVKGHEMGPIQLTRISWEENEESSATGK